MEELEIEKLKVEIELLKMSKEKAQIEIKELKNTWRSNFKFALEIIQGLVIILGVALAYNEFILKDREAQNLKTKLTLDYVQKVDDSAVVAAFEQLKACKEKVYALPVNNADSAEIALFEEISLNFTKNTFALAQFYNVLQDGINAGYFDKKMCYVFLSEEVDQTIDLLSELQSRHYGINVKFMIPDYNQFRGMIEFYIEANKLDNREIEKVPKYRIDKPSTTGYK